MKAARFIDTHNIQIKDEVTPKPGPEEILVKVKTSGICGTDFHIFEGANKGLAKSGTVLGHEFAGIVDAVGSNVKSHAIGDRVAIEPNLY